MRLFAGTILVLGLGLTACSGSGEKYPASTHPHLGQVPFGTNGRTVRDPIWSWATDAAAADFDGDGVGDVYLLARENAYPPTYHGAFLYGDRVGSFVDRQYAGRTSEPSDCVTADFDGDGLVDLAIARSRGSDDRSFLLLNRGARQFETSTAGDFGAADIAFTALAAVDIEGDGDLDLVATCTTPDGGVRLYRNDGAARFTDASAGLPAMSGPLLRVALGDLDGDLLPDLVASGPFHTIVWHNRGAGTFTDLPNALPLAAQQSVTDLDLLHADTDGSLDLVLARDGEVRLWHNSGALTFTEGAAAPGDGASVRALDADQDGDDDLVTVLNRTVRVLHRDGSGAFVDLPGATAGIAPHECERITHVADVDGNGYPDLFMEGPRLHLARGTAYGRYTIDSRTSLLDRADDVIVGDVNGDGLADLLIQEGFEGSNDVVFRLRLNDGHYRFPEADPGGNAVTNANRIADFDGDGRGDLLTGSGWRRSLGNRFEQRLRPWPISGGHAVTLLDADRDGTPEVLLSLAGTGVALVEYSPIELVAQTIPAPVNSLPQVGDLTGNGAEDFLLRGSNDRLVLLANDGAGNFEDASWRLPGTLAIVQSYVVADLDGDGDDDVALTDDSRRLLRWWNDAAAGMRSEVIRTFDLQTSSLSVGAAAPVEGAGPADLLVYRSFWSGPVFTRAATLWHANRGGGYEQSPISTAALLYPAIHFADLDGDRDLDLVAVRSRLQTLSNHHVRLHSTGIARRGLDYELTLQRAPGYASAPQAATIAIGLPGPPTLVPDIGTWFVGTTGLQVPIVLPAGSGTTSVSFPVPATLVPGTEIEAQAMLLDGANHPARFSNPTRDLVY